MSCDFKKDIDQHEDNKQIFFRKKISKINQSFKLGGDINVVNSQFKKNDLCDNI